MRQLLKGQEVGLDPHFRYRGKNQTRVETFSDAAFALAITLLVLSSSVPTSFTELIASTRQIIPFGVCVTLLVVIWYQHYLFFLQYGLQDIKTVSINTILIFLILVYVYPLKFLSRFLFESMLALFTGDFSSFKLFFPDINNDNIGFLMIFYGIGAAMIFLVLAWMYHYALKQKKALDLNDYEIFSTKASRRTNLLMASVPLVSSLVAAINPFHEGVTFAISGFVYFLYTPLMLLHARSVKKRMNKLFPEYGLKS
jgi:uncharacterized membrane protein